MVREDSSSAVTVPQHPSLIANNRAFHRMLVDGIAVECRRKDDSIGAEIVRLIDFDDPDSNDWLAVNQFTVIEGQHNRRPDVVVFVNGMPLGVIEQRTPRMRTRTSGPLSARFKLTSSRFPRSSYITRCW